MALSPQVYEAYKMANPDGTEQDAEAMVNSVSASMGASHPGFQVDDNKLISIFKSQAPVAPVAQTQDPDKYQSRYTPERFSELEKQIQERQGGRGGWDTMSNVFAALGGPSQLQQNREFLRSRDADELKQLDRFKQQGEWEDKTEDRSIARAQRNAEMAHAKDLKDWKSPVSKAAFEAVMLEAEGQPELQKRIMALPPEMRSAVALAGFSKAAKNATDNFYKRQDLVENRKSREAINAQNEATRREIATGNNDTRRLIAAMAADKRAGTGGNKPPSGYRWTPDGDLEAVPGGPADLKTQEKERVKSLGASDVNSAITTLRDAYSRLEKGGGITSTKAGTFDNLGRSLSSSALGQFAGRAVGSENQSARNDIAMTRPALLGALMKATGMSAKQMDSNAELKLWLTTATDPTLDVESNRKALDALEAKYLGGNPVTPPPETPAGGSPTDLQSAAMEELKRRGIK